MQRCTQLTGLCLSTQKTHTKHSDSCWMHTDTHKQQSEKPSLTLFPNNLNTTHTSAGTPDTWYLQEGLLCLSAAGVRMGCMRLRGKVHGDVQRGSPASQAWTDRKKGPSPSLGPRDSNTCSRDGAQKGWHSYSSKDNGEG